MAASKTFTFRESSKRINSYEPYCQLVVKETATSTANNTSTLSVTLTLYRPSSVSSTASKDYSVTVAGTTWTGTTTIGGSGKKTILSKTLTVTHDSDGSKTITVKASFYLGLTWSGTWVGTISLSSTSMSLTTIARASSITSASNVETGGSTSIKWTPNSSSFKFKIKITCGSGSLTTDYISPNKTSAYTYSQSITTAKWAPYITSAEYATATATLYTYSGSTKIGSATKTFRITVNEDIEPSASLSISDAAGYADTYGYLTGLSKIKWSASNANSSKMYGASVSYKVTVNSSTYTSASGTSGTLKTSGSQKCTVKITDSRGRSSSKSVSFTAYAYSSPSISTMSISRQNSDSTKATLTLTKATYSTANGNNTIESAILTMKLSSDDSFTGSDSLIFEADSGTATGSYSGWDTDTFAEDESYDIKLTITDSVGNTASKTVHLSTVAVLMDFPAGGKGLGIGKMAEGDYLDIGMDVNIEGDLTAGNLAYGTTTADISANSYTGVEVSFGKTMSTSTPVVVATLAAGYYGTLRVWVYSRSATGCVLRVGNYDTANNSASDRSGIKVMWIAIG